MTAADKLAAAITKSAIEAYLADQSQRLIEAGHAKNSEKLIQGKGVGSTARQLVAVSIDANATKAIAELRAMSIRNRRSLGQRVRWAMVRGWR